MIVLDTHALVWWVSGGPLSARARDAIARSARTGALRASSITVWEIAMLVARGRLELTLDVVEWIARVEAIESLREFREEVESEFIRIRLAEFDWNISRTAQALGIERTNLHKKLRALGIHRGEGSGQGGDND